MKTLLVGLDNHLQHAPRLALYPLPLGGSGDRLRQMIEDHLGEPYARRSYLSDFERTNLYPMRRAPDGRGRSAQDIDAFAFVSLFAHTVGFTDVVLLGSRVLAAFNAFYEEDLDWLQYRIVDKTLRVWALPHPSARNRWYNVDENRQAAGKLLAKLRARQHIPHRAAS